MNEISQKSVVGFILACSLSLPTTIVAQKDTEETPAEKQTVAGNPPSIPLAGLESNKKYFALKESELKLAVRIYELTKILYDSESPPPPEIKIAFENAKEEVIKIIVRDPEFIKNNPVVEKIIPKGFEKVLMVEANPNPEPTEPTTPDPEPTTPTTPDPEPTEPTTPDPEPTTPTTPDPEPTTPTTPDPEPTDPTTDGSSESQELRFYYYNGDELLKIEHQSGQTTEFQGVTITYQNLVELEDVDEITARTIPLVAKLFESVESVTLENQIFHTSTPSHFNEILGEAVKLAEVLLTRVSFSGTNSSQDIANHSNLYNKAKVDSLLSGSNPYYFELIKTLAENGAFGDSSDGKVGNAVDQLLNSLFPGGVSSNELSEITEKTIGEALDSAGGNLGGLVNLEKFSESSLLQVPIDNVQGIVGQKITLGEQGINSTIDLTDQLTPSTDTPTDPKDWKIFGIGAGKDLSVKGNVTFKNSNRHSETNRLVKDHALAIGALDDIHFHSETWEKDWGLPAGFLEQHLDDISGDIASDAASTNPLEVKNRITMDFEGANLYIGSVSKLQLVNVDLKSGGNLGVGSLEEVHIVSLDPDQKNVFSVGQNTNPTEGDNIQIYASERIFVDGLAFGNRSDEIYMEARTVDLKNTIFPAGSEVKLASELGPLDGKYPTFGISERQTGRVNFIKDVYYDSNHLDSRNSFDELTPLPNGNNPIVIKKK